MFIVFLRGGTLRPNTHHFSRNNLIRGYIIKYNDPPVITFMSINGINAGVGAFPDCSPQSKVIGDACTALTEVLSTLAYNALVQGILFQADYFRVRDWTMPLPQSLDSGTTASKASIYC